MASSASAVMASGVGIRIQEFAQILSVAGLDEGHTSDGVSLKTSEFVDLLHKRRTLAGDKSLSTVPAEDAIVRCAQLFIEAHRAAAEGGSDTPSANADAKSKFYGAGNAPKGLRAQRPTLTRRKAAALAGARAGLGPD